MLKSSVLRYSLQNIVYFGRIIHRNVKFSRRPVRVLTGDGTDYDANFQPKIDPIVEPKLNSTFKVKKKPASAESSNIFREKVPEPRLEGVPQYDKLGENNNEFVKTMTHLKSRKLRTRLNLLALEGKRLISDGIDAGLHLKTIYFSIEENLVGIKNLTELAHRGVAIKKVFYRDLKLFSEHVTSPGVVGIFERPTSGLISSVHSQRNSPLPVTLIADNIRDPGNCGTLIRSAAASGIDKVLCVKGCVDVWETKVVRSGCGAHFRIPIIQNLDWPVIENYLPKNLTKIYLADIHSSANVNNNMALNSEIEMMTSATKENKKVVVDEDTGAAMNYDESFEDESLLQRYKCVDLKTHNYDDVEYFKDNDSVVLIIGSEASGPSIESIKLCYDSGGSKIKIPLECGVDSLNTPVAASVIMYEIKRQFNKK